MEKNTIIANKEKLYEHLVAAQCPEKLTAECLELANNRASTVLLKKLTDHRTYLLQNLRTYQQALDCLDYLTYEIRKSR